MALPNINTTKDSRLNILTTQNRDLRLDSIIPLAVKGLLGNGKSLDFFITDADACGIGVTIFDGSDLESLLSRRVGNQFDDRLQRSQRFGPPVDRNVRKEPMFDLVPLGSTWREMTHGDGKARLIGQAL